MEPDTRKENQILAALGVAPLDRVRLMKAVFLAWHRRGRPSDGPFEFQPYLYGPCAFDLYRTLERLEGQGFVLQTPHPVPRWSHYYPTRSGKERVEALQAEMDPGELKQVRDCALWASKQPFGTLLKMVYSEAPDFATRSVFQGARE